MADRILFLDFDGVLNSANYFARVGMQDTGFSDAELLHHLDPDAVARLERIIVATGAKVVLSTSWRSFISTDEAKRLLAAKGAPSVEFVGETPKRYREAFDLDVSRSNLEPRGAEICEWLTQNWASDSYARDAAWAIKGFTRRWLDFAILDDAHCGSLLFPRQVLTDFATGLLDEHVDHAIGLLLGEKEAQRIREGR